MSEYSGMSGGPSVDSLGLKLSGSTALPGDLKRGDEVELVLRGVVRSHIFEDKVNAQTGDVEHTTKFSKVVIDELESCTVLSYKRRNAPVGQTAFTPDGGTVDASTGTEIVTTTSPADDDIVDAEVVGELERGPTPEGVDPETGEVVGDPEPEPDTLSPVRDPQVPEDEWNELNHDQRAQVNDLIAKLIRFTEATALAENPTDRNVYRDKAVETETLILDEYGVHLIPFDQVHEADQDVLAEDEPPPPPCGPNDGPRTPEQLEKRYAYLSAKRALGAEAEQARADELAAIGDRLAALEDPVAE